MSKLYLPLLRIGYLCAAPGCFEQFAGYFKTYSDALEQPQWAQQAGWSYYSYNWYCPDHKMAQVDAMLLTMIEAVINENLILPGD